VAFVEPPRSGPNRRRVEVAYGSWRAPAEPEHALVHWDQVVMTQPVASGADLAISGSSGLYPEPRALLDDLFVYLDGVLMFRGRMLPQSLSVTEDDVPSAFVAVDYRRLLARRYIWTPLTYSQIPQADIAWGLISHTQSQRNGDMGITRGVFPTGRLRDRTYDPGQEIGYLLDNLSNVIDGFEYGVDANRAFNVYYPWRWRNTDWPLDYPGNLAKADIDEGYDLFANATITTGDPSVLPPVTLESATINSDPLGRWEAAFSHPDVSIPATLDEHAHRYQADAEKLRRRLVLNVSPMLLHRTTFFPEPGDDGWLSLVAGVRYEMKEVRVRMNELQWTFTGDGGIGLQIAAVEWPEGAPPP